jgi:TPR repeat protein
MPASDQSTGASNQSGAAAAKSSPEDVASPNGLGDQATNPSARASAASITPETTAAAPPKKAAKPAPAKPEDTVALGEKYLYGRGVSQSCEKGLSYIKPAAEKSNSRAMITMGALYATGHCLSRDLPTAYRYFALALRRDPDNSALKQNVEKVWEQMTPSERQLAIRMTQ